MKSVAKILLVLGLSYGLAARAEQTSVAEQYLFNALNVERQQHHLKPLQWDAALYRAAAFHADEMAARRTISHQFSGEPELTTRGSRAGAHFSVIAENVAMAPNAVEIHEMWMKSPHHRDNILDSGLSRAAIRVVRRDGELYAVEDFDRAVTEMSLEEQEEQVAILIQAAAAMEVLPAKEDARRTCATRNGYAGQRRPGYVIRFTSADLDRLPDALAEKVASGRYREAVVGACAASGTEKFSAYSLAVMLYP